MNLLSRRKSSASSSKLKKANNNRGYTPVVKIYRDKEGQFRWTLVGSNGKIQADSGEGYVSRHNCQTALKRAREAIVNASIVDTAEEL